MHIGIHFSDVLSDGNAMPLSQDIELNKLAGNTISVPVVGSLLGILMSSTRLKSVGNIGFPKPKAGCAKASPAVWIGDSRAAAGTGSKLDILMPKSQGSQGLKRTPAGCPRMVQTKLKFRKLS